MKFQILDWPTKIYPTTHRNKDSKLEHRFKVVLNQDSFILRSKEYVILKTNMVERGVEYYPNMSKNIPFSTIFRNISTGNKDLIYIVRPSYAQNNGYFMIELLVLNPTDHPIELKKGDHLTTFTINENCIRRYEYIKDYNTIVKGKNSDYEHYDHEIEYLLKDGTI